MDQNPEQQTTSEEHQATAESHPVHVHARAWYHREIIFPSSAVLGTEGFFSLVSFIARNTETVDWTIRSGDAWFSGDSSASLQRRTLSLAAEIAWGEMRGTTWSSSHGRALSILFVLGPELAIYISGDNLPWVVVTQERLHEVVQGYVRVPSAAAAWGRWAALPGLAVVTTSGALVWVLSLNPKIGAMDAHVSFAPLLALALLGMLAWLFIVARPPLRSRRPAVPHMLRLPLAGRSHDRVPRGWLEFSQVVVSGVVALWAVVQIALLVLCPGST